MGADSGKTHTGGDSKLSEFTTTNIGLAAFLLYVDETSFLGAEKSATNKGSKLVFADTATDGMDCKSLERMFFSRESAQLRNAREHALCLKQIADSYSAAKFAGVGERVRL
jgi:hypothetical protein